jgi:hypothetical protein
MVPDNPDELLTRPQTGARLRAEGYPVADKTLATLASRGGGLPTVWSAGASPLGRCAALGPLAS